MIVVVMAANLKKQLIFHGIKIIFLNSNIKYQDEMTDGTIKLNKDDVRNER